MFTVSQRGRDPHVEVLSPSKERRRLQSPDFGPEPVCRRRASRLRLSRQPHGRQVRSEAAGDSRGSGRRSRKVSSRAGGFGTLGRAGFAVSRTGTLVWLRATPEDAKSQLVRVARDGSYTMLPAPADVYQTPRLSPDGRRLAVVVRPGVMTREIRVLDTMRPDRVLFTVRGGDNQSPAWMDNRRLTFGSNRDGPQKIYVSRRCLCHAVVHGRRQQRPATRPAGSARLSSLRCTKSIPSAGATCSCTRVGSPSRQSRRRMQTSARRRCRRMANGSRTCRMHPAETRSTSQALDGSMEPLQLTIGGAVEPVWTREGLFYREGDRMMLVALHSGAPGAPREIFEGHFERDPGANAAAYDVDSRGNFIMLKSALMPRELRVVQNWGTELLNEIKNTDLKKGGAIRDRPGH